MIETDFAVLGYSLFVRHSEARKITTRGFMKEINTRKKTDHIHEEICYKAFSVAELYRNHN